MEYATAKNYKLTAINNYFRIYLLKKNKRKKKIIPLIRL